MSLDRSLMALSDPTRRSLVATLARRPCQAGELARLYPISRPAVAKHLRVLKEAGLVEAKRRGRCQIYGLTPGGLSEVQKWVDQASRMWDQALDNFKAFAEGTNERVRKRG